MSTHELDQICTTLVKKLTSRESLSPAEKTHLSECAECMREVVYRLDQIAEEAASTGERAEALSQPSTQVIEALERGRRVFAREFGV